MALVSYSDSEGSDTESAPVAPKTSAFLAKSTTSVPSSNAPRKIKVDLPSVQTNTDSTDTLDSPPAKRAKTSGAFGGFNSFLPAPKRATAVSGLKKGVSLRTSSEVAFSRALPVARTTDVDSGDYDEFGNPKAKAEESQHAAQAGIVKPDENMHEEVKVVGKFTRFKPLSVSNKKKKIVKKVAQAMPVDDVKNGGNASASGEAQAQQTANPVPTAALPEPKRSLFSVSLPEEDHEEELAVEASLATEPQHHSDFKRTSEPIPTITPLPPSNSLEAVASDLNLTPAQRRQLFGRHGEKAAPNIAHFTIDSEYAANEQLRQAGETVQQQAVKSIAPGKHSLQQLVNNARRNEEVIEEKWAEGRRKMGGGRGK